MSRKITLKVKGEDNSRLDAYITSVTDGYTRSFIKNLITGGHVTVNGERAERAGLKPRDGDEITIELPDARDAAAAAQDIPLDIIYEDKDIAVINKVQGMVTHPAVGSPDGTLVNAALFHIKDLSGIGGEIRPGIVHRLDKDTSGLIVLAKNDAAHEALSVQMQERMVKKAYIALVHGNIKQDSGTIKTNIDRHPRDRKRMAVTQIGREAVTNYRVLERFGQYTLAEFEIKTGRTHQIRVHAKHIGHPVVGDPVYTKLKNPFGTRGQMLHSARLGFIHPGTGDEVEFEAPLPEYFQSILERLRRESGIE